MPTIELTEDELDMVMTYRDKVREANFRQIKQALCDHGEPGNSTWEHDGHTSHEDYYRCTKCGDVKFV